MLDPSPAKRDLDDLSCSFCTLKVHVAWFKICKQLLYGKKEVL